jgi:chromate transporter
MVTFGGAYSVLAYLAQQAVHHYGWIKPEQMLDGLGLAETTPGPLIMVTQFVGFMGAYNHPHGLDPVMAGIIGGLISTWATFAPSYGQKTGMNWHAGAYTPPVPSLKLRFPILP